MPTVQPYPRKKGTNYLDDTQLAKHALQITAEQLNELIVKAIRRANQKSSRGALNIPEHASPEELTKVYKEAAKELFKYFQTYSSDPASTALKLLKRNCREVAQQHHQIKLLQKERMNAGWRYQYLATSCAPLTGRFQSLSDLGLKEADFNATVDIVTTQETLSIYVSVKNRANTIGGPDWPGAVEKLEAYAIKDRNRLGPYLCVFAFIMTGGQRAIKGGAVTSPNTELWKSNYFWPFFTTFQYEEIMQAVLQAFIDNPSLQELGTELPEPILELFEQHCKEYDLIDETGNFNDPAKLVSFFCGTAKKKKTVREKVKIEKPKKKRSTKRPSTEAQLPILFLPDDTQI